MFLCSIWKKKGKNRHELGKLPKTYCMHFWGVEEELGCAAKLCDLETCHLGMALRRWLRGAMLLHITGRKAGCG